MPRRRRQRLHLQTGEHRPASLAHARVAFPMMNRSLHPRNTDIVPPAANDPAQDRSTRQRLDPATPPSAFEEAPINILIVDDEPKNLKVLETILDDPDYRLVRAESADQALLALVVQEFALLILDIRMPGMNGIELAQLIKERKKNAQVPIIFLTAYYNEEQHVLEGYST